MIEFSETASNVLASQGFQLFARIESWFGDVLVADDVPIIDATETQDATLRVPERLTFKVPALKDGVSWVPTSFDSALGCYGQRVRVSLGVGLIGGSDRIEWVNRGWFLIYSAGPDGDSITVEALGLLTLVDEAVLPTEYQPAAGASLVSMIRDLIEPGITVNVEDAPADRAVPTTVTFSDNRLDNVYAALDAWPAVALVTSNGYLAVQPQPGDPVADDAVLELTDGVGGTVVDSSTSITRDGAFNAVVAKGQYPDSDATRAGQEIIQTAYDTVTGSPYRNGGEFSPYLVPYGYASPLLSTVQQVQAAARTRLKTLRRNASRTVQVAAVPHPGIQLGDVVVLTCERLGIDAELGTVGAFSLPYLANGGPMQLTIRLDA